MPSPSLPPHPSRPAPGLRRLGQGLCCLTVLAACSACTAFQPPQPWEKGELARPVMTLDKDALEARFSAHVYFSKEASTGGDGVGGGGCGCN